MSSPILRMTVFYAPEGWRIDAGDRCWGRFQYRVDAEEAALRLAAEARAEGRDAEVLVKRLEGALMRLSA